VQRELVLRGKADENRREIARPRPPVEEDDALELSRGRNALLEALENLHRRLHLAARLCSATRS
jgi:hypothetical protein